MLTPNVPTPKNTESVFSATIDAAIRTTMNALRIGYGAAAALLMTACNGAVEHKPVGDKIEHPKPGDDHDKHHSKELPESARQKLHENVDFAGKMKENGVQKTLDTLQKEDPLLVPEDSVDDVVICCIDERQLAGKSFNVAGAGILASDERLEVIVRNALDIASRKKKQPATIRVRPHIAGQCGAAALSRTRRKEGNMSPKAIDAEAMNGAKRTARLIRERAKDMRVNVVVEAFDQKDFFPDPNHPATGVLVNATSMVANHDRKKGPMFFNVSAKLAGEEIAEDDAILAGVIALLSKHGMNESVQKLPKGTPFRIIFAGTNEDATRLKAKVEKVLRNHPDLRMAFVHGFIVVDTWIPHGVEKAGR